MTEITDKINAERFTRSIKGSEAEEIRKAFGRSFGQLDETAVMWAMLYVKLRRDGLKSADAYITAMSWTFGDLEELFEKPDAEGNADGSASTPTTN